MILDCQHICKSFGEDTVLQDVSFHLEEGEKAAVVGNNGAGKSTLLKIINQELPADSGRVSLAKSTAVGYLAQHQAMDPEKSLFEETLDIKRPVLEMEAQLRRLEVEMKTLSGEDLEKAYASYSRLNHEFERQNGYACRSEVTGALKGLGFFEEDFQKPVKTLSGGEKTRVALGKLLLSEPDLLLLDEPTNHLDLDSVAWLETFLLNYRKAVILVAHDRYFLDRIVTKVVEIEQSVATVFSGNYTEYAKKKAALREAQMTRYLNQQREIKYQEAVIEKLRSFNREKSIRRAESRQKLLDKIEVLDKPLMEQDTMSFSLEPCVQSGNDVLSLRDVTMGFGELLLLDSVSLDIRRGERVALVGRNGAGKTTLLKLINNLLRQQAGEIRLGTNVYIGYYDQEQDRLDMDKTLFEEISDARPDLTQTRIRNTLAAFLFTKDEVFKRIGDLSGGERGRAALAKLMLGDANFLILDEPTNHLDMQSKEILENALVHYTGTVLYVSHDRYFINATAQRVLELAECRLTSYPGNYDYYMEKKAPAIAVTGGTPQGQESAGKRDWEEKKKEQARARRLENETKRIEGQIEEIEGELEEIRLQFEDPEIGSDARKLMELQERKEQLEEKMEALYGRWEELV